LAVRGQGSYRLAVRPFALWLAAFASVVASAITATAVAQGAPGPPAAASEPATNSPPSSSGFHDLYLAWMLASCTRSDPNVGSTGFCGDVALGVESPRLGESPVRLGGELGAGATPGFETGVSAVGVVRQSGGTFGLGRVFVGFDVTPVFLVRPGFELHLSAPDGHPAFGPRFTFDMGSRVGAHLELGLRAIVGWEAALRESGASKHVELPFAYGMGLFARGFP
jgi:hypothetical protein